MIENMIYGYGYYIINFVNIDVFEIIALKINALNSKFWK